MLTIVGAGAGVPGCLTESAAALLDGANIIFAEPEVARVLGDRKQWQSKAQGPLPQDYQEFGEREVVWLVSETPALSWSAARRLRALTPDKWQDVRLVSGIPSFFAQLDQAGVLAPNSRISLQSVDPPFQLIWEGGAWHESGPVSKVDWAGTKPLHGRRVVLLRSGSRIERLAHWLEGWGAHVESCPVSQLADPPTMEPVDQALARVERYHWLIFTSGEAVSRWFDRMRTLDQDVRRVRAKIAVVGPQTAVKVRDYGLVPELMPAVEYSQEGLVEAFADVPVRGSIILFPGGTLNRSLLGEELRGRGAVVEELVLYQNQRLSLPPLLKTAIREESVDAILFTASSQVEYLMEELSHDERGHLNHIGLFSIGPLTTRVLSHYGLTPRREADQPSLRRLAEAVRDYFAGGADSGLV